MNYLGFYLLAKLSDISCFLFTTGIIGLIAIVILTVLFCAFSDINTYNHEDFVTAFKRLIYFCKLKTFAIIFSTFIVLATLLPTTKQAAFIWIAPQIVENGAVKDTVKNIPELTKLGTEYLKQLLEEKVNG